MIKRIAMILLALCVLFSAVFACAESWFDDAPERSAAGKNTGLGGAGGVWGDLGEFMTMGGYDVTTFDSGDFCYQLSEDGQYAVLVAYLGTEENVAFPEQLDGIPVAAVGNAMCVCNEVITNLVIPGSVRYIGTNAFANCRNLKSVVLQEGVTSLGTCCFGGCTELEKIVFPESLEVVSDFVFANCLKLQEIAFGRNLQSIGTQAFAKCAALSLVTIPGGSAVSIGTEAFSECAPDIRIIN